MSDDGSIVAANLSSEYLNNLSNAESDFLSFRKLKNVVFVESEITLLKYPWELVNTNGNEIANDFNLTIKKIPKIESKNIHQLNSRTEKKYILLKTQLLIHSYFWMHQMDQFTSVKMFTLCLTHTFRSGIHGNDSIIKKVEQFTTIQA